jgi:intracellular sulfur oxidation DsrE/DsrF family protein
MNRILAVVAVALMGIGLAKAQDAPYKVVFDLTSRDTLDQKAVTRWVREITASNPKAEVEVVMYGKGFELVMPEKSHYLADVQEQAKNPNVSFKVCQIAMKNNNIEKSMLLKEVQTVPDGIYEIISKQHQGWGYIKAVH